MKALIFALLLGVSAANASETRVAAAADLKFAMPDLIRAFETANSGEKITAIFGSSGQLLQQIENGAPFDLFLSADTEKAAALTRTGKASGDVFAYAKGTLVLWAPKTSSLKLDENLECLKQPNLRHLSVANPKTAPYGTIAESALKKAGVYETIQNKIATAENIAQAAQFVSSGAADAGLLSKSLATTEPLASKGRWVDVHSSLYEPLKQSGVVIKGKNEKSATLFKAFLASEEARKILAKHALTPWNT